MRRSVWVRLQVCASPAYLARRGRPGLDRVRPHHAGRRREEHDLALVVRRRQVELAGRDLGDDRRPDSEPISVTAPESLNTPLPTKAAPLRRRFCELAQYLGPANLPPSGAAGSKVEQRPERPCPARVPDAMLEAKRHAMPICRGSSSPRVPRNSLDSESMRLLNGDPNDGATLALSAAER